MTNKTTATRRDILKGAGAIAADERLAFRLRKSGCLIEL